MSEMSPDTVDEPVASEGLEEEVTASAGDTTSPAASEDASEVTIESVIEAVLFASDEPVTLAKLSAIVETTGKQAKQGVDQLNERYNTSGSAFRIEQIAGGLQMLTLPCYNLWLKKLVRVRGESKLSPASLETLAIVAYKQPAVRADIEAIRGVASGEMIRGLMSKGLIKMVGRADILGRPMQYGTTKKFLEIFGLDSLKDLPTIEELKKPLDAPVPSEAPAVPEADPPVLDDAMSDSSPQTDTEE